MIFTKNELSEAPIYLIVYNSLLSERPTIIDIMKDANTIKGRMYIYTEEQSFGTNEFTAEIADNISIAGNSSGVIPINYYNMTSANVNRDLLANKVSKDIRRTGGGIDPLYYNAIISNDAKPNYRAGYFTHYAGAGTVKSCKVTCNGETVDLCLTRTMAKYDKVEEGVRITTNPTTLILGNEEIVIQSIFTFLEGQSCVQIERKILNDVKSPVTFIEYFTGAFGVHEYQDDMKNVTLSVDDNLINYEYKDRSITKDNAKEIKVNIPDIQTIISMNGENDSMTVKEGIAFSPIYYMEIKKTITEGGIKTWLKLKKGN